MSAGAYAFRLRTVASTDSNRARGAWRSPAPLVRRSASNSHPASCRLTLLWSFSPVSCAAEGPNPGFEAVRAVAGPMGRSVADLERMARVLFGERSGREDYFPAPVPYRDVTISEKLRFGYYLNGASSAAYNEYSVGIYIYTDGLVKGSPACHRAVLETLEALRNAGHECIEIDPPDGA